MNEIIREYIRQIIKESKWEGVSIKDVLSNIEKYNENTWIYFDTETTGLSPRYKQLTEVAAIAVDINNWDEEPTIIDTFNKKISLDSFTKWQIKQDKKYQRGEDERIQQGRERTEEEEEIHKKRKKYMTVQDVLKMTDYGNKEYVGGYFDEQDIIGQFSTWVNSHQNPLLVIQNASFDMKFMAVRKGTPLERVPVLDTLKIAQLHLIPLLKTIQNVDEESKNTLNKLLKSYPSGKQYYSASQGLLAKAFNVSVDNWHTALADVEMLMKIFYHIIVALRKWKEVDISAEHGKILHGKTMRRIKKKEKGARRIKKLSGK
jgi:DNA polymerase III alpha subunit (gram-positive type)